MSVRVWRSTSYTSVTIKILQRSFLIFMVYLYLNKKLKNTRYSIPIKRGVREIWENPAKMFNIAYQTTLLKRDVNLVSFDRHYKNILWRLSIKMILMWYYSYFITGQLAQVCSPHVKVCIFFKKIVLNFWNYRR